MARSIETKDDVFAVLRTHRERIRALGVKRLGIFGSFARSEQTAHSDLDVLVEFEEGQKTFDRFMDLAFLLEDALERRVDLLTPDALCAHLRASVLGEVEYASLAA